MIRRSNLRPLTRNRKLEEMNNQYDVNIEDEFITFIRTLIRRAENLKTYNADLELLKTFSEYSNTLFRSRKVRNFVLSNNGYVFEQEMGIEIKVRDFAVKQNYTEASEYNYDILSNLEFAPYYLTIQDDGTVFLVINFTTDLDIEEW